MLRYAVQWVSAQAGNCAPSLWAETYLQIMGGGLVRRLANASQAAVQVVTLSLDTALDWTAVGCRWRAVRSPIHRGAYRGWGWAHGRRTDLGPSRTQVDKPTLSGAGINEHLADRAWEYAATPERGRLALRCLPSAYRITTGSLTTNSILEIIA